MDKKWVKSHVSDFRAKLPGKHASILNMSIAMQQLGWDIVLYHDSGAGDEVLQAFDLDDYAKNRHAFCYISRVRKFVALDARHISEKLYAHEIGHVILGHNIGATTDKEEREADLFAKYLLYGDKGLIINGIFVGFMIAATIFAAFWIFGSARLALANTPPASDYSALSPAPDRSAVSSDYDTADEYVVITPSGSKYHRPDCIYVQGKDSLVELTIEDAQTAGKEPCKVCKPNKYLSVSR